MFKVVASPWLLARVAFCLAIVPTYFLIYYHVKGNSKPLAARAKWSTAREAACHQAGSQQEASRRQRVGGSQATSWRHPGSQSATAVAGGRGAFSAILNAR